jgi:hypothetical protein
MSFLGSSALPMADPPDAWMNAVGNRATGSSRFLSGSRPPRADHRRGFFMNHRPPKADEGK